LLFVGRNSGRNCSGLAARCQPGNRLTSLFHQVVQRVYAPARKILTAKAGGLLLTKAQPESQMFGAIPLLIVPFVLYNLGLLGLFGGGDDPWTTEMFSFHMMSGGVFSMTLGDLMVLIGLIVLFVETVKSVRTTNASIMDHVLSTLVFIAFLVEFLLVKGAAHSVFFTLTVIALFDVLAGFSVAMRSASRNINVS
jgi:hypothetical protein